MPQTIIITLAFILSLFANASIASAAQGVGRVISTSGSVWVQRDLVRGVITQGFAMHKEDMVITGKRGRVKIQMQDGSTVYIGANSKVSLQQYAMRGKNLVTASFDMFWGKARFFVSKLVRNDSSFKVRTSTAVLGVRGTEFLVLVPPTKELLNNAFKNIDHASLPALPTRMVLVHGAVDVGAKSGKMQRVTAGQTTDINTLGKVNVRTTKETDMDVNNQQPGALTPAEPNAGTGSSSSSPQQSELGEASEEPEATEANSTETDAPESGSTETGSTEAEPIENDFFEAEPFAEPLSPAETEPPATTVVTQPVEAVITNTIQNLGTSTDVRIQPSYVQP